MQISYILDIIAARSIRSQGRGGHTSKDAKLRKTKGRVERDGCAGIQNQIVLHFQCQTRNLDQNVGAIQLSFNSQIIAPPFQKQVRKTTSLQNGFGPLIRICFLANQESLCKSPIKKAVKPNLHPCVSSESSKQKSNCLFFSRPFRVSPLPPRSFLLSCSC